MKPRCALPALLALGFAGADIAAAEPVAMPEVVNVVVERIVRAGEAAGMRSELRPQHISCDGRHPDIAEVVCWLGYGLAASATVGVVHGRVTGVGSVATSQAERVAGSRAFTAMLAAHDIDPLIWPDLVETFRACRGRDSERDTRHAVRSLDLQRPLTLVLAGGNGNCLAYFAVDGPWPPSPLDRHWRAPT